MSNATEHFSSISNNFPRQYVLSIELLYDDIFWPEVLLIIYDMMGAFLTQKSFFPLKWPLFQPIKMSPTAEMGTMML